MKKARKKPSQAAYYRKHRLARYVALAMFTSLPFVGFLIGYYLN